MTTNYEACTNKVHKHILVIRTNNKGKQMYFYKLFLYCGHNTYSTKRTRFHKPPRKFLCPTCLWNDSVAMVNVGAIIARTTQPKPDNRQPKADDHNFSGHGNDSHAPF